MRRRRAALATSVVAVLALGSVAPADAQGDPDPAGPELGVELVSQTTWVEPDGDIVLRLDASGAGRDDRLRVTFHGRITSRGTFVESLAGEGLGRTVRTLADATVAELDPDADGRIDVTLGLQSSSRDVQRLLVTREGLYPIAVELAPADAPPDEDAVERFVTHVARLPTTIEQTMGVAVVQPLGAPPSLQPDGTTAIDVAAREILTSAAGSFGPDTPIPVTYSLTAETLDALAVVGAPNDAALLADLAATFATGSVAASPYVRIDPDALRFGALNDLVAAQIQRGTASVDAHLGRRPDGSTWIADTDLGATGLSALADAGIDLVVVPHETLAGERPDPLVQPFDLMTDDGRVVTGLATDPGLQSHIGSTGSGVLDAQHLLADLAFVWFERPAYARGTVVRLPDGAADRRFVQSLLQGLATSPLLTPGTVPEVVDGAAPAAIGDIDDVVEEPEDRLVLGLVAPRDIPDLDAYRAQLERTRAEVESFATVFEGSPQVERYEDRMAVSASADLDGSERNRYLALIRDDIDARTANIGMPDRGAITLPSRDGVIPLTLVNNTGSPVDVAIQFASDKLEFPDGERLELTLVDAHTPIEVRVRALSSGAFPLDMSLESPDGRMQFVDSRYTVRSTAVSGLGIALSVTAVLVLGAWWLRTARRARAARHAAAAPQ